MHFSWWLWEECWRLPLGIRRKVSQGWSIWTFELFPISKFSHISSSRQVFPFPLPQDSLLYKIINTVNVWAPRACLTVLWVHAPDSQQDAFTSVDPVNGRERKSHLWPWLTPPLPEPDQSGTSLLPLSRRSLFSVFSHVLTLDWDLCPAYNILCLFRRIRSWAKKALEACGWKWREKSNLEGYCMSSSVLLQDRFISRIHKYIIFTFWIIVTEMFKFALLRVSKKKFKRISRTSISYKRVVGYSISSKKALSVQFKIPLVGHIM